jgi:hypothetical protein
VRQRSLDLQHLPQRVYGLSGAAQELLCLAQRNQATFGKGISPRERQDDLCVWHFRTALFAPPLHPLTLNRSNIMNTSSPVDPTRPVFSEATHTSYDQPLFCRERNEAPKKPKQASTQPNKPTVTNTQNKLCSCGGVRARAPRDQRAERRVARHWDGSAPSVGRGAEIRSAGAPPSRA